MGGTRERESARNAWRDPSAKRAKIRGSAGFRVFPRKFPPSIGDSSSFETKSRLPLSPLFPCDRISSEVDAEAGRIIVDLFARDVTQSFVLITFWLSNIKARYYVAYKPTRGFWREYIRGEAHVGFTPTDDDYAIACTKLSGNVTRRIYS